MTSHDPRAGGEQADDAGSEHGRGSQHTEGDDPAGDSADVARLIEHGREREAAELASRRLTPPRASPSR